MRAEQSWEYRLMRLEAAEAFEAALNKAGAEGWEAVSCSFTIGEIKNVSLVHGIPVSKLAGVPVWSALMKRVRRSDGLA
jgi:hypothetical protein